MSYILPLEPRPPGSTIPLTATQRTWWHTLLREETQRSPFRNIAASLRLSGPLHVARLERSIESVLHRHEALRIRISHLDAQEPPSQIVDPRRPYHLAPIDLTHCPPRDSEQIARRLGKEFLSERVDLREGPVFDARLLKVSATDHVLMLALDHIISDATSYAILTREILSSLSDEPTSTELAEPTLQFPDYAVWHCKTDDIWRTRHEPYWTDKLSRTPRVSVPEDSAATGAVPPESDTMQVPIGKKLTAALRDIARHESCLVPMILLSLYAVIMSKWVERNDLLINFISHGRHSHPELRDMIGCFAHPVFLRVDIHPRESLRDLLKRVTSELHSSLAHDACRVLATPDGPTEVYFNWLPSEWGPSGAFPSAAQSTGHFGGRLTIRRFPIGKPVCPKFAPAFTDTPSGIVAVIWYNGDLFLRSTMDRFAAQLQQLLSRFVRDPNTALSSVDLSI